MKVNGLNRLLTFGLSSCSDVFILVVDWRRWTSLCVCMCVLVSPSSHGVPCSIASGSTCEVHVVSDRLCCMYMYSTCCIRVQRLTKLKNYCSHLENNIVVTEAQ